MAKKLNKAKAFQDLSQHSSTDESLIKEIRLLTKELRIANSFKQKILSALINGFATVMGATILVALVVYLLTQLASNIEFLRPLVENIVGMVKSAHK